MLDQCQLGLIIVHQVISFLFLKFFINFILNIGGGGGGGGGWFSNFFPGGNGGGGFGGDARRRQPPPPGFRDDYTGNGGAGT